MRSAEILVLATRLELVREVFRKICHEIIDDGGEVIFGFLPIDEQFQIQLYGFEWKQDSEYYDWARLCRKSLGSIVLFNGSNGKTIESVKPILQYFETEYQLPIVAAYRLDQESLRLPVKLYRGGLTVTTESRFAFYNPHVVETIRDLLVGLININLELMAKE